MGKDDHVIELLRQQVKAETDAVNESRRKNDIAEKQLEETRRARVAEQARLKIILDTYERIAALPDCLNRLSLAIYGIDECLREMAGRLNRIDEVILLMLSGRSNGNKARAQELRSELEQERKRGLLYQERRTLQHLEEQAAKHGLDVPVAILNQIEDTKIRIEALKSDL